MSRAVIVVDGLEKTYRSPLRRKKVQALRGISLSVHAGEIFGFLGPNGAGKTTTIRILMGLIRASAGTASILGHPVPTREARARLGFLPEAPYFYDYLTVTEVLDLAGRLFGIERKERRRRAHELIERVGLEHARDTPLSKYSKGMLQRAGIAQALINDPELVVLDEPMSGLDPVGRRDVREIIESLRDRGKTVFFSSHILADVETLSDRVGIVVGGRMRDIGRLSELERRAGPKKRGVEIRFRVPAELTDAALAGVCEGTERSRHRDLELWVELGAATDVDDYLARARAFGAKVVSVIPKSETLEDLFLRLTGAVDPREPAEERDLEPAEERDSEPTEELDSKPAEEPDAKLDSKLAEEPAEDAIAPKEDA